MIDAFERKSCCHYYIDLVEKVDRNESPGCRIGMQCGEKGIRCESVTLGRRCKQGHGLHDATDTAGNRGVGKAQAVDDPRVRRPA